MTRPSKINGNQPSTLGLRHGTLALAEYDPIWAERFKEEAALISNALDGVNFQIDHIGSTAVPGLSAKAILDIAVQAEEEAEVASALVGLGYIDRGVRSGRLFIRLREGDIRTHNLHLYRPNDPECLAQIAFRDRLRRNSKLRDAYASLKRKLARDLGNSSRREYTEEKTHFIRSVLWTTT